MVYSTTLERWQARKGLVSSNLTASARNMQKVIIIIVVALLLIGALFFIFKKPPTITNYPSQGKTIVAFGDSLVEGIGATMGNDFSSLLSKLIGEPIINMGVAGNTSNDGLLRVESVNAQDPKVVMVLFGGNDY